MQTIAQHGPSPARATVPQAREGTSVKTPTGSTSADSAMIGIATLVGRIAAPPAPNGQMSAQVVLVDLESNQTVNGLVSAENRFAFQNLGPGVKYYLAAWQHLTAPANEAASTLPSEIRLSWHQLVQVDASGTFSIDLSRENCDAMYSNDVLPTWALQAPENGRRAVLTRVRGAVAPI
ncbi:MAG: hypothetical protein EBV05_07765 [Cyanobacteria bacterium WB6_1B_304]|nr:hypothetical protein [Cyanobacteria bacterium WB6_1B_304]